MTKVFGIGVAGCALILVLGCSDEQGPEPGPDMSVADLALDVSGDQKPDPQGPDLTLDGKPDAPRPDLPPVDLALPDAPAPDLPAPDLLVPDAPAPDLPAPDLPAPDLSPPDVGHDGMCSGDASLSCYPGPAATKNVGLCKAGTQICSGGLWSKCAGAVLPAKEACDGQDNDCNGATDEGLVCVTTVVGQGDSHRDGPAAQATFYNPYSVAVAPNGDLVVADGLGYRVRRISGGKVTTLAGSGIFGYADGAASSARFGIIWDVAITASGDVVVIEPYDNRLRKISGGKVSTFAGDGTKAIKDGPLLKAQFYYPWGIDVDSAGVVYVGATNGGPIRKISGGQVTSIAGSSKTGYKDGLAAAALFSRPQALAAGTKEVFVLDAGDYRVRKIAGGQVTTVLGDGTAGYVDGPLAKARLNYAHGIQLTASGDLLVADTQNRVIRRIDLTKGVVSTLAGVNLGAYKDGPVATAQISGPWGVARGTGGELYLADQQNSVIRKLSGGKVSTYAGSGVRGYKDGPSQTAQLGGVTDVALGPKGELYVTEVQNRRVRKVYQGQVTTIAGDGTPGLLDGPALKAKFRMLTALKVDKQGAIYVTDTANRAIRKISGGQVTTIAGNGKIGYLDGPALSAKFAGPFGLALGPAGEVYVADTGNRRIRLVSKGQVTTIAGDGTMGCKDGPALKARFGSPFKMDLDPQGALYIADNACGQIRKLYKGQVTSVAGTMVVGFKDGEAKTAKFAHPRAVIWAGAKTLLVGDTGNHRVRRISW